MPRACRWLVALPLTTNRTRSDMQGTIIRIAQKTAITVLYNSRASRKIAAIDNNATGSPTTITSKLAIPSNPAALAAIAPTFTQILASRA